MLTKDDKIFNDKSLADVMADIYTNSKHKHTQINSLIEKLQPLITSTDDASIMVPLIKEYLEISVKNDEQLVKLAQIIQRLINAAGKGSDEEFGLTDLERAELMSEAKIILKHSN